MIQPYTVILSYANDPDYDGSTVVKKLTAGTPNGAATKAAHLALSADDRAKGVGVDVHAVFPGHLDSLVEGFFYDPEEDEGDFGEECGEECIEHADTCDGFCDHGADHVNACKIGVTPEGLRMKRGVEVGCGRADCQDCYEPAA